jgi:hypothetical protein
MSTPTTVAPFPRDPWVRRVIAYRDRFIVWFDLMGVAAAAASPALSTSNLYQAGGSHEAVIRAA